MLMNFVKRKISQSIQLIRDFRKFRRDGGVVYCPLTFCDPSMRFIGKKVLVVGGSSGMGLQIVKDFLEEGAIVVMTGRNKEKLNDVQNSLSNTNLHTMTMDIADVETIQPCIEKVNMQLGGIDIFVNCAGVLKHNKISNKYGEETFDYDYVMGINHRGIYHLCKYEGDYLIKKHIKGRIVNISSVAGERLICDPYTLSKWGVNVMTKGLAKQLAPYGICVNAVAPGRVPSSIDQQHENLNFEDNAFCGFHKNHRLIHPKEIAGLVLYLCSDLASSIIGQVIGIDGGFKRDELI